jgi:hypothetical protein
MEEAMIIMSEETSQVVRSHTKKYKDTDRLTAAEGAAIISENSGRVVPPEYMANLVRIGRIRTPEKFGPSNMYRYGDIKNLVVSDSNRGRKRLPVVSARSLQQRAYREKKRRQGLVE